jgi:predicted Zn-dependent peptidase
MKILNINGFTLLYEKKPTDITTIRYIVNAGSTSEKSHKEFGSAHFLEHMFFKGTEYHNYKEINRITSELGNINAYTSMERTVFYIKTLSESFKESATILSEMFFHPLMDESEFKKEKTVILEEYQSGIDNPFRFFYGMMNEGFWGTSFGHKIVGNKNSILEMSIDTLNNFRKNNYVIDNVVIAVVGNVEESIVVDTFSLLLDNVPSNHYCKLNSSKIEYNEVDLNELGFNHKSKQSIIGLTVKSISSIEHKSINFCGSVFAQGIGGGMHSMLFDRIREELGLCYNVGTLANTYKDVGELTIYCMLDENNIKLAKEEILGVVKKVREEGFDEQLLNISKKGLLFETACESENSEDYAALVADTYFLNNCKCLSYQDKFESLKKVTNEDIKNFANKYFSEDKMKFVCMTTDK